MVAAVIRGVNIPGKKTRKNRILFHIGCEWNKKEINNAKKVYEIIEPLQNYGISGQLYDVFMMITIIISIIPLAFKTQYEVFKVIDIVTVIIFIIDYVLRLITAYLKMKKGMLSFVKYPFTPMAIIDLVSILPYRIDMQLLSYYTKE